MNIYGGYEEQGVILRDREQYKKATRGHCEEEIHVLKLLNITYFGLTPNETKTFSSNNFDQRLFVYKGIDTVQVLSKIILYFLGQSQRFLI